MSSKVYIYFFDMLILKLCYFFLNFQCYSDSICICHINLYFCIFSINFSFLNIFFTRIHMDMPYYIWKQHVKFESIIIIKSEEILVLMERTWYLSLPALLKHVCTDNFVQDAAISIKIVGKFRYNCGML